MIRGWSIYDGLIKSQKSRHPRESGGPDVVPAKAGNQFILLDSRFHGNDEKGSFTTYYESIIYYWW
jgi:hypothetical protein